MKKNKPISMDAVSELFRQAGMTSKIKVQALPGESLRIGHDEQGNEVIKREIKQVYKKYGKSDKELLELIIGCLKQDKFLKDGCVIVTRISEYFKKTLGTTTERNFRNRVKSLLPCVEGVIQYNGKFYYKKHKNYKTPK